MTNMHFNLLNDLHRACAIKLYYNVYLLFYYSGYKSHYNTMMYFCSGYDTRAIYNL